MFFLLCSVKPTLKKVSKYENKFAKLQKKAAEFNFRNQLKVVKKKEFTLEDEEKEVGLRKMFLFHMHSITIFLYVTIAEETRLVQEQRRRKGRSLRLHNAEKWYILIICKKCIHTLTTPFN